MIQPVAAGPPSSIKVDVVTRNSIDKVSYILLDASFCPIGLKSEILGTIP